MTKQQIYLRELKHNKERLKRLLKNTTHLSERQKLYDQLADVRLKEMSYSITGEIFKDEMPRQKTTKATQGVLFEKTWKIT